jgi:drug/metabolite transporter (DMT)-like permease
MTLFGAFGGFYLKKVSSSSNGTFLNMLILLSIGGTFYLIGAILNIYLLSIFPYTLVFPLTSITYLWTLVISGVFLKERVTPKKMIGVTLIIFGCIFLSLAQ